MSFLPASSHESSTPRTGFFNAKFCEIWAKYCFPNDSWSSPTFQTKLFSQHLMLCSKHFRSTSFIDKKLFKTAVPDEVCDKVVINSVLCGTEQSNIFQPTAGPSRILEPLSDIDGKLHGLKRTKHYIMNLLKEIEDNLEKEEKVNTSICNLVTAAPNITVNATFQPSEPMIISEGYNSDHQSFVSPVSHLVFEPSVSTPSRACVESVAADTCKTDDKTTQADTRPIPNENNADYWKQKLTHILHSTQFCGICLSTDELVNTVNDHFEIVVGGTSHSRTLADILDVVFQETEDILSNSQICSSCTQKLLQSYIFIQQTRARSKMLKYHLNDLYNKTCYIRNNVVEDSPQEHSDVPNVIISMENYDNFDQFQNNLYTKPAKKKVKMDRRRLKQSYKCLTCNLILPSLKAWRVHEITNHKINKMSKTQLNSVAPHQRMLKRMCRICHKVVKNGELLKHLKKYHVDSLCTVCCVAFNSLEDLEAHKQEWHYSDVSKCLMCLRSYSEAELQQHQCWFSCNICTEAPCVHHKYLTCYRLQILNGALRAKCLDCQFVCRTKRAYLEHVNMCHLKFSAESSVKCTE